MTRILPIGILLSLLFIPGTTAAQEQVAALEQPTWKSIDTFSSRTSRRTATFDIGSGVWRIRWEIKAIPGFVPSLDVWVQPAEGRRSRTPVISHDAQGTGMVELTTGSGRFHIEVVSINGEWTLEVEESTAPEAFAETEQLKAERLAAEEADRLRAERIAAALAEGEQFEAERAEAEQIAGEQLAAEGAEAEGLAAEQAKAKRLAAEQAEAERLAAEQAEAERLAAEQAETERLAAEQMEAAQLEAERLAADQAETERLAAEQAEAERVAAEQAEAEQLASIRLVAEQAETERLATERAETERLAAEQAEAERLAAEQAETERLAAEQAETERLEAERLEVERLAAERLAAEQAEAERLEAEQLAVERAEAEQLATELLAPERAAAEKAETERLEADRLATERAEAKRLLAERAKAERLETQRLASERAEANRLERARFAAEEAEAERLAAEQADAERLAAEPVAAEREAAQPEKPAPPVTPISIVSTQACTGNPARPGQSSVSGNASITDGAAGFKGRYTRNLPGPLAVGFGAGYTSVDAADYNVYTFGGEVSVEATMLPLEICPVVGITYVRSGTIEFEDSQVDINGWVVPIGVAIGNVIKTESGLRVLPFIVPQLQIFHANVDAELPSAFLGCGPCLLSTSGTQAEFAIDLGATLAGESFFGTFGVNVTTMEHSNPTVNVGGGYTF